MTAEFLNGQLSGDGPNEVCALFPEVGRPFSYPTSGRQSLRAGFVPHCHERRTASRAFLYFRIQAHPLWPAMLISMLFLLKRQEVSYSMRLRARSK
jgi:hypothetical protein